jgi:hypothetical protein
MVYAEYSDSMCTAGSISEDDIDEHGEPCMIKRYIIYKITEHLRRIQVQLHHFPPKATASNYHGFIR